MTRFAGFVIRHSALTIALLLGVTIVFAASLCVRGIGFNGSLETLAQGGADLDFYKETQRSFGDDRVIIAALTTTDVFTSSFIAKLDRLTRKLAALKGVADAQSLTSVKAIRSEPGRLSVGTLLPPGASDAELAVLKPAVTGDLLYAKHYVSVDGRTAAINVFVEPLGEAEVRFLAGQVEQAVKAEAGGDEVFVTGVPVLDARGIRGMMRDMLVCSPAAALLCFLVFLAAFRRLAYAALAMGALTAGLVWIIGLMSLLGRPITIATLSLPTVLIAVGGSYIFHVLNQHRLSTAGSADPKTAWLSGLKFIGPAVLVSGLTVIAGFLAVASSAIPAARDMGVFNGAGVLVMLFLTLTLVPAVLSRMKPGRSTANQDYARWLNNVLRNVTALVLYRRRRAWWFSIALTGALMAGLFYLKVKTDYLAIFPKKSETVQDAIKLHERLAGASTIEVILSGGNGAAYNPGFLRAASELEKHARRQNGVDAAISIAGIVARINGLLPSNGGRQEIPEQPERVKAIFNDFISQDDLVSRLVSSDYSRAVIALRTNLFDSDEVRKLTGSIDEWARTNLPPGVSARVTGPVVLLNNASEAVARSQASSLAIALITIYIMIAILFRSFVVGLLALIPNLLPIAGYFGFLGWAGIPLDITTSLIASAALGLAVDNAVHMIRRYRQSVGETGDQGWVMWLTMIRTGKPMVLANAMLIAAFMIFMLSSFVPVRLGGLLWAVTILACLLSNLIVLPLLMKSRAFNPGPEPAHTTRIES